MRAKKSKEPIKIRFKELADGNKSIYLDIYKDGLRKYEFLKLYIIPEKTPFDKQQNKVTMDAANAIKARRIIELTNDAAGIKSKKAVFDKMLLSELMQIYADERARKGQSLARTTVIRATALHLDDYKPGARLKDIDLDFCKGFAEYIRKATVLGGKKIRQSSASAYFVTFNSAINLAVRRGFMENNPILKMESDDKPRRNKTQRDFLTLDELNKMIATPAKDSVKLPFLFSCFTGLRYGDIVNLQWGNIIEDGEVLKVRTITEKTQTPVFIPIPNAETILPQRGTARNTDFVFRTLVNSNTNRNMKNWADAAGIDGKHITFHTARHTYATLLLTKGADLYTVSKLLGHSTIKTTQIYAEIIDKKKEEAANLLQGLI